MFNENKPTLGYKVFYNAETKQFEAGKEKSLITYEEGITRWFVNFESAENNARMCNEKLAEGKWSVITCSDCGNIFEMDCDEIAWYNEKGFNLPKRCFSCRQKRKDGKNKVQEG